MQSKNNTTQGLLREMSSKTIKSPQIERISSLDSGRPPVMIFTSRGKVARKSINSRVFEALGEGSLRGMIETGNLNQQFDKENSGNNRHVNGKVTANGVSSGTLLGSTETISKLRRPAPPAPVPSQAAPATGTSLVSSKALSLSSSLQSLNNRHSLDSDSKVQPPLIPAPKSFIQRQSSLSSSTSSLSSPQTPPTSQLQQPTMTARPITINLTQPTPPADANNNREDIFQAPLTDKEYQQASQFSSVKKIRAPEPPDLPSPPPPPSPPPHTSPHSPLPSPSSPSSSSASSSPLNRFRFPPPPSTPPSPMEIPDMHTSFTNTSVSSPGLMPSQTDSDRDRKRTLSPNEVMNYFDEAIGDQTVSASTHNDASGFSQFSPVFHFPSVSDDKQPELRFTAPEAHTQIPGDVGSTVESTETATSIATVYSSKVRNEEESGDILHAEFSYSEKKTSEENSTQNQGDDSLLSPKSEEERKRRGNAASRTVAVSKLQPEVKTVRQHIKPGTVDELANLFANMKDELITSPANKGDLDFNIRQTLEKLESLDKSTESKSPVMRNSKRATILSASELFPRIQSSVSAESLQGRPRSLHSPAYSKVNQWPRLYQASSTNTLYTPPDLPDPKATSGFDFLAASREIHKHVVLIRSNSRAGGTAPSKVNDYMDDSSKISDNVSNLARKPSNRNTSPINSQERNSQLTEDIEETFNIAEDRLVTATMTHTTEVGRMDISHTDSVMVTGESLRDAGGSFDATIENQFISEFPHPTITPTNSRNSSRRSSLEDNRKSEAEHVPIDVSLIKTSIFSEVKRLERSQSSSRSHSPDRPTSSRNSSRRSSLEDEKQKEDTNNYSASAELEGTLSSVLTKQHTSSRSSSRSASSDRPTRSPTSSRRSSLEDERQKEDTNNYSASAELEGTLSSLVARPHTGSRSSSRSNSPDRKLEVGGTHALDTTATSFVSGRVRSRSSSVKSESKVEITSHNLNNSSGSSTSTSPANSKSSSRASSVRHRMVVDDTSTYNSSVAVENDIVSKVAASISASNDTNNRTVDMVGKQISLDDHSNATFDGLLSYSENTTSFDSNSIQAEHRIAESHHVIEDHQNTTVPTNLSTHSSRSSSRSGSLKIRDYKDEVNLELPHVTMDTVAVSTVDHTRSTSNTSSRSSSPEKRSTEVHTIDNAFSKAESLSSGSRKSSQSESQEVSYGKLIQGEYETTVLHDHTSSTSSRKGSLQGSLNASLEHPSSFLEAVAVKSGAIFATSHTSSKSSSRSCSPDRNSAFGDMVQPTYSLTAKRTSINSTPERSRRSSQADEEGMFSDQTTNEHYGHERVLPITAGSVSSRSSPSGSLKIRGDTDEVHVEHSSSALETTYINAASVYATNTRSSGSGSSSPHRKVSSEDINQSYDITFLNRRDSASSTPDSSRKSSSVGLTTGDRERETNVETSFTLQDHLKTDWQGFLKTETKSKEESTAAFIGDMENTHNARETISPRSSKSSSRDGSPERSNTDERTAMESKTALSTPSSSRSSSRAGSVLNKVSAHDSESLDTALVDSFGFTVKSTASSSSSKSSNSVNRDDNREFYINDQNEASHSDALSSILFHSNHRTDGDTDLDHKSLNENYATEFVTSASSSRSGSPTKIDSSATLRKEHHDSDFAKVSIPTSPAASQKSSRESSPDRNKESVEHSSHHIEVFGNIATSTFAARKSPASSRRSSHASSVTEDIQPRIEQAETHTFLKKNASSSNSPAGSRRSSDSHEADSTHRQLHFDTMDVRKFEDTDAITVKDLSSEIKSQPREEASHASVSIINSGDVSNRMSPVSSRRNSLIGYLHYDVSQNPKGDTASLASNYNSSSSFTTTPAGSRRTSRDVDSVKDIELDNNKHTSDLTSTGNVHAGSVTGMYVLTRSRDTSPDGSLKQAETWDDQETDSYQLALQSAFEPTTLTSISSSKRSSPVSFVKRGSDSNHSSSSSSKHSSRSASPTRNADSDFKTDNFNVTLDRIIDTASVNNISSANYTNEISNNTSLTFTKAELEVGDAYNTSLSNTENLGKTPTSPMEHMSYTLTDEDASAHGYSDTHGRIATPSDTRVNITEGKQFDLYYTEFGSKHLADSELRDTHRSQTFLPPPRGEILASNFGSNVNFSEKENISSVDSMFHLASLSSNDAYHSEVSQSMKDDGVDRTSFSASADMYSQQHLAGGRDEVTKVIYENHDYSGDDGKHFLDTDETPAVEYGHTLVDIHTHDREDTLSHISTMSQLGSDRDGVIDIPDESDSSDSDNSSSHKSSHDVYTVNQALDDDSSAINANINVYSFSEFKQGIAHTSSNQLSSLHDKHEDSVPEVITKGYETVIVASSEKDTGRGSRKSSSSGGSDVSSGDKNGIPVSETLKNEDGYEIYENIERKTHVLTRQENVASQLSEVVHEQTGESQRSLTADHSSIVSQAEVSSGLVEDNADVIELRSHKDTEEARTGVVDMQFQTETDASTSTIAVQPATPGIHGDMELTFTPATDESMSSPPRDFLSVLDDINIETDITSAFLRRSSRFSGTYSPARRQSRGDSGDGTAQTNTGLVRDSATEATLSSTSFILRDYQAKDTAHTTHSGSRESVDELSASETVTEQMHSDVKEDREHVHSFVNDIIHHSVDTINTEDTETSNHVHDWKANDREDKQQVHSYVSDIIHHSVDTISTEDTDKSKHANDWNVDDREDKQQAHSYVSDIIHHSFDTLSTEDGDKFIDVHDGKDDDREDKQQAHSYVSDIIHHSFDTLSTEDRDKFIHVHDGKDDDREDKQQVHSYVSDIIHHSVDTISTEDTDQFIDVHDGKDDDREDKQQVHSYVSDIIHHSVDTISTEDTDQFFHVHDGKDDDREDKQQVHSYVSDIVHHSVDTISTEDTHRNTLATDWKIETDSTRIYNNEVVSEMKTVIPATTEVLVQEVEIDSRVPTNETNDSLDKPFSDLTVERLARADIHTDINTSGEISQSYPEHGFHENAVYESFDHMEATKSSGDAHLHFSEANISKEHDMQLDVPSDILDHHVDGFSMEHLEEEDHLDRHDQKPSIHAYVGVIITHSIHTVNAESTEDTELAIHEDHVTPSHLYVNHSAHLEVGEPTQSHTTAFEHHSKYVNTSSGQDHSNDDHSSQLNIVVNNLFNKAEVTDTALLHSNTYDSVVENNDDDNNKEDTTVVYEEMQPQDMSQTNAATRGLHIFNDDVEARVTDNEDIHPHIISGLETTNVNYGFHETREKVQTRLDDQDEFISEQYLLNESRGSHTNNILHHLTDDMNRGTARREDHFFEINKENESNEAYIGETAFDFLNESYAEQHPPTSMQDEDATVNKYKEATGDTDDSDSEFNIEASRREELQTVISSVAQSEEAYDNDIDIISGHHLPEVSNEETKTEFKDVLHKNTTSLYINDSSEVPSKIHKIGAEIDLDDEIRKQHQILSPRLIEDDGYEEAMTFNPDNISSRSSSINSSQIADRHHTTRETAFNSEFFVRSRSSSDAGNHELSRQNSGLVTAASPLFLHEDNDNNSLAELHHKEHLDTLEEFNKTLDINYQHSISSRSSVDSGRSGHQTLVTSDSFRLDNAGDTEKERILPSTDSLLAEENSFHTNLKLENERLNRDEESTYFGSAKARLHNDVQELNREHVSQDRFGTQDRPERNLQESDADFKSVKQTKEEYISVARLSQTLHSVSNDDDSAQQKEDESHLFSKDKFQALRSVFEKQETVPETSSFKTKRNSYKLGIGLNSTSESLHGRNWELNRQVSSSSSLTSTSKNEMHGHLTSAVQIEDYTSIESDSDRVMAKWSGSDHETNENLQDQAHKKMDLNKKLSYDLQTRQLRRGSASSLSSASSEDSTKRNDGEGHSPNVAADDHYPKNNLFSQKPGLINMTQWNTQSMYGDGNELAQTIRRSSVSSDLSSASQKEVAGHITADYHASIHKEKPQELHSLSDTDQNQLLEIPGEVTNPLFSDTSSTDDDEPHSLSDTNQNQLLEIPEEVTKPRFGGTSSTEDEKLDFRKRTNTSNSLSSDESSSLEIEDHSLFSQETVGRFSPSDAQEATHIQTSFVRDTDDRNSDKSSMRSQSTLRSSLGGINDSLSPSDTNFSFRKNNLVITNTAESPTDHVKPQVAQHSASQSSDRGAAVRRHSSSGSEKEAKLIGAFLRSNVRSPLNRSFSNISHHSSETGNVKSHRSNEPVRHADVIDATQSNRRESSSTDSSDSVKAALPRPAGSVHSEISLAEAYKNEARNYEDLTSDTDHNTQKHTFQSEDAFTVVSHNFSQPTLRRDSLSSQEDTNNSHIYSTAEEQNHFRSGSENGNSPNNLDDRPAVKTYVIKRSIANDVYVEPNEYFHESVFNNNRPGVTQNSSRDFNTSNSAVAREVTETYSETQEPTRQWQWQSSQSGVDSFNQGITSKKENLSLERDWGYRDKIDSNLLHESGEKRHEIKRTGLDTSPIFPSLLSRDTSVREANRYTAVSPDRDTFSEGYRSPHGVYDDHGYSIAGVPLTQYAEKENVLRLQSRAPNVVDTTNLRDNSLVSPGARSTTILRNRQSPIDDRFQFTPITISTASQAVVGNKVGVHIDFSPPGAPHSLHDISSSSDEESNRQRFVVKNVQQTSVLNNLNNSSEIIFTKEEATTENVNRITNASGSLSPRTVVDGPIFRTYQSQRPHLSRSLSSDNSLASPLEYINDPSPQVYDPIVINDHNGDENGHLYQVLNVSSNGPELSNVEAERSRSRNRNKDLSGTKNQSITPRKQHHSPERFFKNPKLSLRQEDYDNKGYSSDDEEGKHYQHVTKVYLSGEAPRSRSQSPSTNYRVSSLKSQNGLEKDRSKVRSSGNVRNGSPEISDNDSHSEFQGHQQRYKVIGTSDTSFDTHTVRAQSSPKLGRKQNYFQETAITRTQTDQPPPLNKASASAGRQTHKSVVQLEVGSNYITEKHGQDDIHDSRYVIKRVRSAENLRDTFADNEDAQGPSDRKMWKTGKSRSTDGYLSRGDAVDGEFEPTGLYDQSRRFVTTTHMDNKMYVVNKPVSNRKGNVDNASTPHGWYTSTIDLNERGPTRIPSHDDKIHSQNYKTEKTLYLSNTTSPPPSAGHTLDRTREFVFHDHGQSAEINSSDVRNEHHQQAERFERINQEMAAPHDLDYTRSTEDLSNDLRVLRGKILIKNRFDSAEFSEDDFDQNANLFDTSFHLGKDNPVYSSDQDITASLRREEERDISRHVTQDITFETVDKLAQQYKADRQVQLSPGPQRKKPNLSSLLLSKLALVDSKDIRQTVDVEHHNEEIHGDIRFVHADGEQKPSKDTYNFDSVNEKVELTLTQGKANVIIKVIAERVVPTGAEFNTWRKSQAIVTRHIEIDLQANEQMKRLYKRVMSKTGNSGSLDGSGRLSSYNSASLSAKDREMSSMETLKLFTQILDVAEQQSSRDNADPRVRHDLGQLPASVMDMLY